MKDYLSFENTRNKTHAALYEKLLRIAYGAKNDVLVGHHICFEPHGDITQENEIPSADTILFDHDVMDRVFGNRSHALMQEIAVLKPGEREERVSRALETPSYLQVI